jgi:hypothetical protein
MARSATRKLHNIQHENGVTTAHWLYLGTLSAVAALEQRYGAEMLPVHFFTVLTVADAYLVFSLMSVVR